MRSWAWLLLGASALACSGEDEAVGVAGRSGQACLDYQDALCSWVLRCTEGVTRADCEASASSIACSTDGTAESCTRLIDRATCHNPPDDCELFDVADRAPAQQACESYLDAVCEARVHCGAQTFSECRLEAEAAIDCSAVVGVKRGYSACLTELETPDCEAIPPASCVDVLLSEPTVPM